MSATNKQVRGVRGAITVERDDAALIIEATQELLQEILTRNNASPSDVVSAFFTMTDDLRSEFPARAAREVGWSDVAMLCSTEVPVPGGLERCIRVLMHVELAGDRKAVRHAYLRGAAVLRPDL